MSLETINFLSPHNQFISLCCISKVHWVRLIFFVEVSSNFTHFMFFVHRMRVKKLPKILALHLKRFKYMEQLNRFTKLSHRVLFTFELRLFETVNGNYFYLSPYICFILRKYGSKYYLKRYLVVIFLFKMKVSAPFFISR